MTDTTKDLAADVLGSTPLIDGHNDLPSRLRNDAAYSVDGLDEGRPSWHTDIPRLREGRVGAQFWSVYVPSTLPEPQAVVDTLEQIDAVHRLVARYPETFALAYTADDVERTFRGGRIASLIGVEGGHSLAGSLGVLRSFARLGVRYVTLTHNDNTAWADSATDEPGVGGLNDVGRAIVAELNRIGVLVDLSHTAASTQHAALDASEAPVIFSHSSAKAVADHPRNVDDSVLGRLRDNGGVVQVTFVPAFISPRVGEWFSAVQAEAARLGLQGKLWRWAPSPAPGAAADEALSAPDPADADAFAALERWRASNPRPRATLEEVIAHLEHLREAAGAEHIGIGGDYDGIDVQPDGLEDVASYPRLFDALAARSWSADELAGLAGRNVLRALRDAERIATEPLWPDAVPE